MSNTVKEKNCAKNEKTKIRRPLYNPNGESMLWGRDEEVGV